MLTLLRIKNLALVEEAAIEFGAGFTVLSGETGAGKSIIIGALTLALGGRADRSAIRSGADSCIIETEWSLGGLPVEKEVAALCEEGGADGLEGGVLRLRRVLSAAGQNRQFVNGSPVGLALLDKIGGLLADFHGPHDHQSLLSVDTQRTLLDRFGGLEKEADTVATTWTVWRAAEDDRGRIEREAQAGEADVHRLTFEAEDIEKAELKEGEEEEVTARLDVAQNATRILERTQVLLDLLEQGEGNVSERLASADRALKDLVGWDARCSPWQDLLTTAQNALADMGREVAHYADHLEVDPSELARLNERYSVIQTMKRRYGGTVSEILQRGEAARARLERFQRRDEEVEQARARAIQAQQNYDAAADILRKKREGAAKSLGSEITRELRFLGFQDAGFAVRVDKAPQPAITGWDAVEFVFAPNAGEGWQPMRVIASTGEVARVMLAVKTALARQDHVPLLVFDEVDANVGAEVAARVAEKMRDLADTRQVLCITHQPQAAARGAHHFAVRKKVVEGRTVSLLDPIEGKAREDEIVRMLGEDSEPARLMARNLLGLLSPELSDDAAKTVRKRKKSP
jgi:DNA repair protein RecN (Recombination protein N)